MTRNVSSIVNTVFYINHATGAHWRENNCHSDSEWFDTQSEPEGPPVQNGSRLQPAHVIFSNITTNRFPATGSPYTDTANWHHLTPLDKEDVTASS